MTMAKTSKGIPRFSPNTRDVGFWAAAHTRCVIQVTALHVSALSATYILLESEDSKC
jgi:hypothetical protein